MRARLIVGWVILLSLVAAIGFAQNPPAAIASAPGRPLSLEAALETARRNNPDYLSVLNDRWPAGARERSAVLGLFTPTASVSAGSRHTNEGTSFVSGIPNPFTSPANTGSSWSLGFNYSLSGSTIANRGLTQADSRATESDIAGALTTLETNVRSQYLNLLAARAVRDLTHRSLERVTEQLNLARARYSVGQGTLIDVRRAEVDNGQAEVNVLTANQSVDNETLKLYQQMGVPAPEEIAIEPTDSFPVVQPGYREDSLIRLALAENPGLRALQARVESARWGTRAAYSQYLPSLNFSAGLGGYRQSVDSNVQTHAPATSSSGSSPWNMSVFISVPIYDAFSRASQIQQARAGEDDLRQAIRARELSVRAQVSAAFRGLVASYEKIGLQQRGKTASLEALDLATQRYRVGSGTYLELLDARYAADQADANYVNAVYDYHKAIAQLEVAVGRRLH
jgi:outer membrane protein